MGNQELVVKHSRGSYVIELGASFASASLQAIIADRQVCVVTNTTVAPLYLPRLVEALGAEPVVCELPDGEQYKTVEHWLSILDSLLEHRYHRDCVVIALGGGVVGDMAGFAAASYQRGVDFIQVPTTLLSQVDSSIGGKTGINHPAGKNMIGAFWQPKLVVINTDVLQTLPEREYCSGFAEIIKAGIIGDPELFEQLEAQAVSLLQPNSEQLPEVIARSCRVKQLIVERDEQEHSGERALLNLGHTFAHAIEQCLGYGAWLHGEAVGLGLVLASSFAAAHHLCEPELAQRIANVVGSYRLPTSLPGEIECAKLAAIMTLDKKVQQGRLRMVLPRSIGRCELTADYSAAAVQTFLQKFQRSI
jgi:3-dehydroquinate synthase